MINLETLKNINYIIENDSTSSTYKYALLKSVIEISQKYEHYLKELNNNKVSLPLGLLVEKWIFYYLPFILSNISQQKAQGHIFDKVTEKKFQNFLHSYMITNFSEINSIREIYFSILSDWEQQKNNFNYKDFFYLSKEIARIITNNPMQYLGNKLFNGKYKIFNPLKKTFGDIKIKGKFDKLFLINTFGEFEFNKDYFEIFKYLGSSIYGSSTIIEKWKEETININKDKKYNNKSFIEELICIEQIQVRDTSYIRNLLKTDFIKLKCVWSDKNLTFDKFDIDHIIPYSIWGNNELWNLLPTSRKINQKDKKVKIPSPQLIEQQKNNIKFYWNFFFNKNENLFKNEIQSSLIGNISISNKEQLFDIGIIKLKEKCHYLIEDRKFESWNMIKK